MLSTKTEESMIEDYKTILNMIDGVDPSDTAKLDEIDARFWCYLNKWKFAGIHKGVIFTKDEETQCEITTGTTHAGYKYTRSRDALKAIREGRYIEVKQARDGKWKCWVMVKPGRLFSAYKWLPTEELAELHAIIQAISYERENK